MTLHGGSRGPGVTEKSSGAALYVVATPIGNLRDISLRALDVLKSVDLIAAEDTRVTRALLSHFGIAARTVSAREHNEARAAERVVALLREGKSVALVSDAGTPAVSDPGARLVAAVRNAGYPVVPVPGASAALAALSASGVAAERFAFRGFLPSQPGARRRALEELKPLAAAAWALVFYEAPHRVADTLRAMAEVLGSELRVTIAKELTKVFETLHSCPLGEAAAWLRADPDRARGEFVLIVEGRAAPREEGEEGERVLSILLEELPLRQAVSLAAKITGARRNALYEHALAVTGRTGGA